MKIKPELEAEYKDYVEKNKDPYGRCAVNAGDSVLIALSEGKTPEESIKELDKHDDLTGFLAGAAIQGAVHFSPRGEELKDAWNKRYDVPAGAKGTVNPAIITLK